MIDKWDLLDWGGALEELVEEEETTVEVPNVVELDIDENDVREEVLDSVLKEDDEDVDDMELNRLVVLDEVLVEDSKEVEVIEEVVVVDISIKELAASDEDAALVEVSLEELAAAEEDVDDTMLLEVVADRTGQSRLPPSMY